MYVYESSIIDFWMDENDILPLWPSLYVRISVYSSEFCGCVYRTARCTTH